MTEAEVHERTVLAAIALANRAPSVHNSQPWLWRIGERSLHLHGDMERWLPATDPDARDLVISCGAALHHVRIALSAAGVRTVAHRLPNRYELMNLAAIELHPDPEAKADRALAAAIEHRRTDRRRYADSPLAPHHVPALARRAAEHGVLLSEVTEPGERQLLARAIVEAANVQTDDLSYAWELATWSGERTSSDGVPSANLPRADTGTAALPMRHWPHAELPQPRSDSPDGATILILATSADDRSSQLRAGEATGSVLLHATTLGLATCALSQPLEVPAARRLVREQVLGGTLYPQLLIRVGWPPSESVAIPVTRRRPVADTLVERRPR